MTKTGKQLSNPFSTGNGAVYFEAHVQASFLALMLTGGYAPCMPHWPIKKIKLQGKFDGYDTDDLIIFIAKPGSDQTRKILGQIKHSISITENDIKFGEVIQAAWNDFNNSSLFTRNNDAIALITGPLSATDVNDVRTILEWARHSENSAEFFKKVNLAKFSSRQKQTKLNAFRKKLNNANGGNPVSEETFFEFLKHFHFLGYDLDIKTGVTLSLLHSLIGQYSDGNTQSLWACLVDEVQSANKNAGTITLEGLSNELKMAFKPRASAMIPSEFSSIQIPITKPELTRIPQSPDLVIINLLGAWNENNNSDLEILHQLIHEEYTTWIPRIREILQLPESPITLKDGLWRVTERKDLLIALAKEFFDQNLDDFKQCAVTVLSERDPSFDLPIENRYAASLYGKVLKYSPGLRKGMTEGLALLGTQFDLLKYCSQNKREAIAALTVREIFENADWILWGSLNNLLPILAEAAPDQFLEAVDNALIQSPCPFDELFSQEGNGSTGRSYITGLLWALETLAWDEKFLVRVCVILGDLASRDPGGQWANRPANSLTTILLPWFPQTTASIEKRKVTLTTLQREFPSVAWKLLLCLLPNQHQTSMGTHKPSWRDTIPENWQKDVPTKDYWDQVFWYADLAILMANSDIVKLNELIDRLGNLPQPSFNKILEILSSAAICNKPEEELLVLWNKLTDFALKHRRFSDANWALSADIISKIESVAAKIAPKNPLNLHQRLFSDYELALFDSEGNWEEQRQTIEKRRQDAIKEILAYGEMIEIIRFAESVETSFTVGHSLGVIADTTIDSLILPGLLETENNRLSQFVSSYVWSRQYCLGWAWVDELDKSNWSFMQISQFLSFLPFTKETWNRVAAWLGSSEKEYWRITTVNPYQTDGELVVAIDKLIEFGRPHAAINCLFKMLYAKHPLDSTRSVKALLAAVSSTEPSYFMKTYEIVELIKALQNDLNTNPDDLFRVEWAYLSILDHYDGTSPKILENRLASDPAFFCELIRLIYRSTKEAKVEKFLGEQHQSVATNAFKLLRKWRTPPGTESNEQFSPDQFTNWLKQTEAICTQSGHLEVALSHLGQVLIYCPPDPDGLWIHRTVAEALNSKNAEEMRRGYDIAIFNSRGVYWVDPTGKPERDLAEQYRHKAEEIENAGYQRFAVTLRHLAESYDHDADRIINGHR